ncbi:MAG: hypothetical protein JOZ48_23415 [Acidobacteriaceae bacterium]|nr:hypothetical protein [Acidobacteriaceae bacterium]
MELLELSPRFGAFPIDTRFLDVEVAQFFLISQMGLEQDQAGTGCFGFVGECFGKLALAPGVNGVFEFLNATQTPVTIDDDLDEFDFLWTDGLEIFLKFGEEAGVFMDIVGREENGAAGERGLDCVLEDLAKPASVRGPVDFSAFTRLAASCSGEMEEVESDLQSLRSWLP